MEKNKLLMIIIIVLLLLILGVSVGFSVYTLTLFNNTKNQSAMTPIDPSALDPENITTYTVKDTFKTNLLKGSDNKDHLISVDISFAVTNVDKEASDTLLATLEANEPMIKSNILTVIRNRTAEELSGSDAPDVLGGHILKKLQEVFNTNLIVEVFVSSLYVS